PRGVVRLEDDDEPAAPRAVDHPRDVAPHLAEDGDVTARAMAPQDRGGDERHREGVVAGPHLAERQVRMRALPCRLEDPARASPPEVRVDDDLDAGARERLAGVDGVEGVRGRLLEPDAVEDVREHDGALPLRPRAIEG